MTVSFCGFGVSFDVGAFLKTALGTVFGVYPLVQTHDITSKILQNGEKRDWNSVDSTLEKSISIHINPYWIHTGSRILLSKIRKIFEFVKESQGFKYSGDLADTRGLILTASNSSGQQKIPCFCQERETSLKYIKISSIAREDSSSLFTAKIRLRVVWFQQWGFPTWFL